MMSPTTPVRKSHHRRQIPPSPRAPLKPSLIKANSAEPFIPSVKPVELGTLFYTAGDETERFQINFEREESTISRTTTSARHIENGDINHRHIHHYHTDALVASICKSPLKQWRSPGRKRSPYRTMKSHRNMKFKKVPCSV